ncbi:Uncharacterised protein [uncultured Clostridium sp.]|nr:Uncharacterised protein [uncultured Clostridium sp.]
MKVTKKVVGNLEKCYSLAMLDYKHTRHFLVAAEKVNKCLLYDLEGELEETVWEQPGGVMSMVQVPGTDGQFLATHQFYSPNDSAQAKIVIATPKDRCGWEIRTLVNLPFVHRFDIFSKGGVNYLIACTLKSGHEYKDDWSMPGKIYAAVLPDDLGRFNGTDQLELTVICDNMPKNHGYYRYKRENGEGAVISCERGVFLITPPDTPDDSWNTVQLIGIPASDAVLVDLDGCGEEELFVMSPFHGDTASIYKKHWGRYEKIYEYPEKAEFLHALYGGDIGGIPTVVVGHRKGARRLLAFRSDKMGSYKVQVLDQDTGAANVLHYKKNGMDIMIAANRETDEIAMYEFEEETCK